MQIRSIAGCLLMAFAVTGILAWPFGGAVMAQGTSTGRPPGAPDPSKLPKTPKIPDTFEGLFEERDARAVGAVGFLRCLQGTVSALRAGALGNVSRDWSLTCIEQGREWRGVFGQLVGSGIDVRLQYAFRTSGAVLTTDRVDTSRVNGTARALLRGLAAPLPGAGKYEFTPVPLPQGKFVEVWFLPVPTSPTRAVVGGDSLIQMSEDGVRELGHGRATPPIRVVSVPLTGATWTLESPEERIPAVSELVVARMALDLVPEVRVRSRQYESVLTRGARGWVHRRL
ncbi:MAG: hypothetical protein ABMA00_16865 [Gemmatimonas sp.]